MKQTFTAVILGCCALVSPQTADACRVSFIEVEVNLNEQKREMEEIEGGIQSGHIRRSFLEARRLERRLRRLAAYGSAPREGLRALRQRIENVMAVATVRLAGRLDRQGREATDKEARTANLQWALDTLRAHHAADPTALNQARVAEAMAQFEEEREAAADILQGLADRDVMPDTYAYRTLALLQSTLGRDEQASTASRACILSASMRELPLCPVFG